MVCMDYFLLFCVMYINETISDFFKFFEKFGYEVFNNEC